METPMSTTLETIPAGKPLMEAIEGLFASRYLPQHARLEIWGTVRGAVIAASPDAKPHALDERAYLLQGHASHDGQGVVMFGVVSWTDNGIPRVMAGQLHDAASEGVSVLIPGGSVAQRSAAPSAADAETISRATARPPAPRDPSTPPPEHAPNTDPPAAGWSDAVSASQRAGGTVPGGAEGAAASFADSFGLDGVPNFQRGDIVVHPRYGRCTVVRSPKFHRLKLRRTTGAFFDLHLKVCSFEAAGDDDGHAVYRVQIVGRASPN